MPTDDRDRVADSGRKRSNLSLLRRALAEGENSGSANYSLEGLIQELDTEQSKQLQSFPP